MRNALKTIVIFILMCGIGVNTFAKIRHIEVKGLSSTQGDRF